MISVLCNVDLFIQSTSLLARDKIICLFKDSVIRLRGKECMSRYKIHRFDMRMSADELRLEKFLNDLKGEVVTIIQMGARAVDFLLIVEKVSRD